MVGPDKKITKASVEKRKAEIAENKFLDVRKEPGPIKFHDFARDYLAWSKTNKKASTYIRDVCIMKRFDREFEGKYLHKITTWQIDLQSRTHFN